MQVYVNIAAYKFTSMTGLDDLRTRLLERSRSLSLKGTVLISEEGINLFIAGGRKPVDAFMADIRALPGLHDLEAKESFSTHQPFSRMLVKRKKEIIPFGVDGIDPRCETSPRLAPEKLKAWLDEGKPVTLLDVRNNFEFDLGTFEGAVPIDIDDFRRFPDAAQTLPQTMKSNPVVTFCTGGIRCEKAAPLLEREGFEEVYQLEGGILKYFEVCGSSHFQGECFVFDKRVALDAELNETDTSQCFGCQATLRPEDRASEHFVEGVCCPYCRYKSRQTMEGRIARRHRALAALLEENLPGDKPYDLGRPVHVTGRYDGCTAIEFLAGLHTRLSEKDWRSICDRGDLRCNGLPVAAGDVVRAGQRLVHLVRGFTEPPINADIRIIHEDEAMVVVDKPAPLPMHACGRFHRNSLMWIMNELYHPEVLRSAHRLDAGTTGVVILSRSRQWARRIQPLFEKGEVRKKYVVRVNGVPQEPQFVIDLPLADSPSKVGARVVDESGLPSQTEFRVHKPLEDGTTLLEAVPLTGRTNQIRVHLWDVGMPVVGDPLYLPERKRSTDNLDESQAARVVATQAPTDPPMCLHASSVTLKHPLTGEEVEFRAALPAWASPTPASPPSASPADMDHGRVDHA